MSCDEMTADQLKAADEEYRNRRAYRRAHRPTLVGVYRHPTAPPLRVKMFNVPVPTKGGKRVDPRKAKRKAG